MAASLQTAPDLASASERLPGQLSPYPTYCLTLPLQLRPLQLRQCDFLPEHGVDPVFVDRLGFFDCWDLFDFVDVFGFLCFFVCLDFWIF